MFGIIRHCQNGSPALEMVVFTPLALFFLFIVFDAGFCLLDKASLSDALRSGLHNDVGCLKNNKAFALDTRGEILLNSSLDSLLSCIHAQISANVKRERNQDSIDHNTRITVKAVLASFNKLSGALISYHVLSNEINRGSFDIRVAVPKYPAKSPNEFIAAALESELLLSRSNFAIPEGVIFSGLGFDDSQLAFQESALFIFGEIATLSGRLNPSYSNSVLGRFYALQAQEFHLLRLQLS